MLLKNIRLVSESQQGISFPSLICDLDNSDGSVMEFLLWWVKIFVQKSTFLFCLCDTKIWLHFRKKLQKYGHWIFSFLWLGLTSSCCREKSKDIPRYHVRKLICLPIQKNTIIYYACLFLANNYDSQKKTP